MRTRRYSFLFFCYFSLFKQRPTEVCVLSDSLKEENDGSLASSDPLSTPAGNERGREITRDREGEKTQGKAKRAPRDFRDFGKRERERDRVEEHTDRISSSWQPRNGEFVSLALFLVLPRISPPLSPISLPINPRNPPLSPLQVVLTPLTEITGSKRPRVVPNPGMLVRCWQRGCQTSSLPSYPFPPYFQSQPFFLLSSLPPSLPLAAASPTPFPIHESSQLFVVVVLLRFSLCYLVPGFLYVLPFPVPRLRLHLQPTLSSAMLRFTSRRTTGNAKSQSKPIHCRLSIT